MFSTHHTLERLARGLAVAALVAALTTPVALAKHDPWFNYAVSSSAGASNATFVTDTLAPGGGIVAVAPAAQGFEWADAGIGAASTVGVMLILLGGTRLVSHRRGVLAV
jgi:hypothetical protein